MYKNHIDLIGFLGSDPETRSTSNGTAVTTFSMATKSSWKNEAGSYRKRLFTACIPSAFSLGASDKNLAFPITNLVETRQLPCVQ